MRVDLDAKVKTRDGHDAGAVQRAVIDPRADNVSDFVISTGGLLGYDVLVRSQLPKCQRPGWLGEHRESASPRCCEQHLVMTDGAISAVLIDDGFAAERLVASGRS
jgi:hypothetical protein